MKSHSRVPGQQQESASSFRARTQQRPWSEPQFEPPPAIGHDFSQVDLFSHAPQRPPIQAKLTVGEPNDQYEQEADQVADRVMAMAAPPPPPLQRQETGVEEEVQAQIQRETAPAEEEPVQAKFLQRETAPDQEETPVQAKSDFATAQSPTPPLEDRLNHSKSGGVPLPENVRTFMEPRFGADFSQVRVHTGSEAIQMNQELNAQAFTHGRDVYFGSGKTPANDSLTAHELTHVVQQTGGLQKQALSPIEDLRPDRQPGIRRQAAPAPPPAPVAAPPPAPVVTPASYQNAAALYAMTLNDFDSYATQQADWANSPAPNALSASDKRILRSILEFGRAPDILNGCGTMTVQSLKDKGMAASVRTPLRIYSRAVAQSVPTVELHQTDDVDQAIEFGRALQKLEQVPGGPVIHDVIKGDNPNQLEELINDNKVDALVRYSQVCRPLLHANNGAEIESFLALHRDDGVNPISYHGRLHRVKNFHRFEKTALDRLVRNEQDTSKTKPLALVLHSAFDHNGAFHRDPKLTEAIVDNRNHTLMIEGASSLAEIQGELRPLARRYGQNNRISQVMIAGHGNANLMELAGTLGVKTGEEREDEMAAGGSGNWLSQQDDAIDLHGNAVQTNAFFQALLQNMDNSPNARIVLNACLTASNSVTGPLPADPAQAQQQINAAIAANPSLATHLQQMATNQGLGAQVLGANASIGQVGLIDPATGQFNLVSTDDPAVTADKFTYVRQGREPEGALRAVVETWAIDQARCLQAVRERYNNPDTNDPWQEAIIHASYGIILSNSTDANLINLLAQAAGGLTELRHAQECRVGRISRRLPAAHLQTIFNQMATTGTWTSRHNIPLVVYQVWMQSDASKQADFLAQLSHFNCQTANPYVDTSAIATQLAQLLPLPPANPPPANQLKLALIGVEQGRTEPGNPCREYLRAAAGGGHSFPASLNINGLLAGLSTENAVLEAIGLRTPAGGGGGAPAGGATTPPPNVDLDGDGTNDFYVDSLTRRGGVTAQSLRVRARPDLAAPIIGGLAQQAPVFILGQSGEWFAIEFGSRTAFVHGRYIRLTASL